jgi:hypothetical protein
LFLLVWDKDKCTERFQTLFPCTYVLQPILVNFYSTSLQLPGLLLSISLWLSSFSWSLWSFFLTLEYIFSFVDQIFTLKVMQWKLLTYHFTLEVTSRFIENVFRYYLLLN